MAMSVSERMLNILIVQMPENLLFRCNNQVFQNLSYVYLSKVNVML